MGQVFSAACNHQSSHYMYIDVVKKLFLFFLEAKWKPIPYEWKCKASSFFCSGHLRHTAAEKLTFFVCLVLLVYANTIWGYPMYPIHSRNVIRFVLRKSTAGLQDHVWNIVLSSGLRSSLSFCLVRRWFSGLFRIVSEKRSSIYSIIKQKKSLSDISWFLSQLWLLSFQFCLT